VLLDIRVKPGNKGTKSGDKGTKSGDKGAKSGDKGAMSGDKGAMLGDKGAMLGDQGAMSVKKRKKLIDFEIFKNSGFFKIFVKCSLKWTIII